MGRAKRSLSQHFLVDPNLQRKVVAELEARPGDVVLEVGPGHGELTRHLLDVGARLVLLEKDRDLAAELAARWGGREDVQVVEGDALEEDLDGLLGEGRPRRVLSNLPYAVSTPLLFRFMALSPPAVRIVVTVQREVAERVVAEPGSRAFGALSVGVQARARARLAFAVSRRAFRPVPGVESAALRIDPAPDRIARLPAEALRRLTRAAFGRRRKQLQKILRSAPEYALSRGETEALCRRLGLDPRGRPETLSAADFVRLARALEPKPSGPADDGAAGGEAGAAGRGGTGRRPG